MEKLKMIKKISEDFKTEIKEGTPDSILIAFRCPEGERLQRRFMKISKVQVSSFPTAYTNPTD